MRSPQGRRDVACRPSRGSGIKDVRIAVAPRHHLLRGGQRLRARRGQPPGVHRPARSRVSGGAADDRARRSRGSSGTACTLGRVRDLPDGATVDLRTEAGAPVEYRHDRQKRRWPAKVSLVVARRGPRRATLRPRVVVAETASLLRSADWSSGRTRDRPRRARPARRRGLRGLPRPQGSRAAVPGQYPVPTYVGEFLLGRYCATTDPDEIAEGLEIVERVDAGAHRPRRRGGAVQVTAPARRAGQDHRPPQGARLDAKSDSYKAELPSLQLNDIHISDELVNEHERMLTGGFYAEVTLEYIAALAQEQGGQPFRVESDAPDPDVDAGRARHVRRRAALGSPSSSGATSCSAASASSRPVRRAAAGRPAAADGPVRGAQLQPVELGPRGTGKSHLFQQVSPYAHLVSGGKATVANMFVNNEHGRRGARRPVRRRLLRRGLRRLLRPEGRRQHPQGLHGVRRVQPRQGEHPRRRRHRHGRQLRRRRLSTSSASATSSEPLPKEMRNDTAFMDRIHAYLPGWDVPKLDPSYFTDHFGFVSDFLAECWTSSADDAARRAAGAARMGEPAERAATRSRRTTRSTACFEAPLSRSRDGGAGRGRSPGRRLWRWRCAGA